MTLRPIKVGQGAKRGSQKNPFGPKTHFYWSKGHNERRYVCTLPWPNDPRKKIGGINFTYVKFNPPIFFKNRGGQKESEGKLIFPFFFLGFIYL